ncbi:trk system potassium uptake protein TrkH [Desulfohalotomaculum tongense]|uniref:TrkH family potassium uptake protein n=1 Tax=Desulforadius tongensis TaxID=1216062 RepID=UPI00195DF559|nr:TrkH family potassium uptake protein [Desulforadius tongensis]MBM7854800.1 trk system potassium uptake protein TrkH [Desulforadius tongensis]
MNIKLVAKILGMLLCCEAAAMLPSLAIAAARAGSDLSAFLYSILVIGVIGFSLALIRPQTTKTGPKEGFVIAAFGWLLLALFGTLPFIISGELVHPVDAFFETMSGFTTTGASVIDDIESLPKGLLFWRSLTHWLGGMGIIVLTLALIPSLNIAGLQMFKAEVPGPTKSKALPRVAQTSRQLYKLYLGVSLMLVLLLKMAGMTWFDSFIHTFGTVATGGFSSKASSIGAYGDPIIELIIVVFMIACGINFGLYFSLIKGDRLALFKDAETRVYLSIIFIAVFLIGINLVKTADYEMVKAFREALFQVASIMTSTGYATADFDRWPDFSRYLLVMLMFVGACAGSTGGGIKVVRFIILFKAAAHQLKKLVHPQAVIPLRVGRLVMSKEVVQAVQNFFILHIFILAAVTAFLTLLGLDIISAFSATIATLSNIGPGLGLVGPAETYSALPAAAKVVLAFCMLIGRLEIYTVLVVFTVKFWE